MLITPTGRNEWDKFKEQILEESRSSPDAPARLSGATHTSEGRTPAEPGSIVDETGTHEAFMLNLSGLNGPDYLVASTEPRVVGRDLTKRLT